MARLIYSAIASLDGYVEDDEGKFGWAAPDAELHGFVNELERQIGTYLYGRRMYETMVFWETAPTAGEPAEFADYAEIWRAADKVVYSRTLREASTARTRIESEFDPSAVAELKSAAGADLSIGGAELAAQALEAGLGDEVHLFLHPIVIGAGKAALPPGVRLELLDQGRFEDGVVHLHYAA